MKNILNQNTKNDVGYCTKLSDFTSGGFRGRAKGAFAPPPITVVSLCVTLCSANCVANVCTFRTFAPSPKLSLDLPLDFTNL